MVLDEDADPGKVRVEERKGTSCLGRSLERSGFGSCGGGVRGRRSYSDGEGRSWQRRGELMVEARSGRAEEGKVDLITETSVFCFHSVCPVFGFPKRRIRLHGNGNRPSRTKRP